MTTTVRQPLSRKHANVRPIDLDGVSSKQRHLSLSKSKATPKTVPTAQHNMQMECSVKNGSLPNSKWEQRQNEPSLTLKNSERETENNSRKLTHPSRQKDNNKDLKPVDELQQHTQVSNAIASTVKGRKAPSGKPCTLLVKRNNSLGVSNEVPEESTVTDNAIGDCTSIPSSPGANEDSLLYTTNSILSSSPASPLFYEKIAPIVRRHDADRSTAIIRKPFGKHSPLAVKHRSHQEHIQSTNLLEIADKPWNAKHTRASRSLLPELTMTATISPSSKRQTIPHASRNVLSVKPSKSKRIAINDSQESVSSHPPIKIYTKPHSIASTSDMDPYLQTCPICDAEYPTSIIEEHANECIGDLIKESTRQPKAKQRQMTQTLLTPLKKAKPFTVYRDEAEPQARLKVASRPVELQEKRECPICKEKINVDLLQRHVEEELDERSSKSVTVNIPTLSSVIAGGHTQAIGSENRQKTTPSISVDDDSDSECSVIDLATDASSSYLDLRSPVPNDDERQRSLSPVEGFQDIRQLQSEDPGYQMYFRQFGDARLDSSTSRKRRNNPTTADQDGGEPGITPTVNRRKPNRNYRRFRGGSNYRRPRQRAVWGGRK
ncbi:hypothetical protein BGW37DRAFT_474829 [Umbelopsis sp. PMI_123]|nr:hypothetical protein BGW37DRAFT_474829 [Umbelopsis sp. PMI_123]